MSFSIPSPSAENDNSCYLCVSEIMTSISPPIASSSRCAKTTSSLLFPDLHSPRQTLFIAILFICLSTTIAVTTPPTFTRLPRSVWLVSTLALRTSFRLFHYFNKNNLSPTFPLLLPLLSRSSSFSMLPYDHIPLPYSHCSLASLAPPALSPPLSRFCPNSLIAETARLSLPTTDARTSS